MLLAKGSPCQSANHSGLSPEQMQAHLAESYAWMDDLFKKGILSAAQPLAPERKILSGENGGTISDGANAESKEVIAGFFILNVQTMDEAVSIARTNPMLKHGGQMEVRRIAELTHD